MVRKAATTDKEKCLQGQCQDIEMLAGDNQGTQGHIAAKPNMVTEAVTHQGQECQDATRWRSKKNGGQNIAVVCTLIAVIVIPS